MSGTMEGGRKAAETNFKLHGKDFYKIIGAKGGRASGTGGFACLKVGKDGLTGPQRARIAGAIGGMNSDRTGVKNGEGKKKEKENEEDL